MRLGIKNIVPSIKRWIKENKSEFYVLSFTLLLGTFLRLYKIGGYMTFLGDEGRDAIIVRRFLTEFDLMLVGPGTSIGNMYLGPLYYYLMAPAMLLANLSPIGPAIMIALLGVITIWFVWFVVREWFPATTFKDQVFKGMHVGALVAAFLYAIAPTVIIYSRSSWNPNIMPFFSLLCVYSMWRVWVKKEYKWLIAAAVSFAFALQSHYLAFLIIPVLGVMWLIRGIGEIMNQKSEVGNQKSDIRNFLSKSILGLVVFAALMSPLFIFDARHGWRNYDAMRTFFTVRQTTVNAKPWKAIPNIMPIREQFLERIFTSYNKLVAQFFSYFTLVYMGAILVSGAFKKKFVNKFISGGLDRRYYSYVALALWAFITFIGLGLYKQEIYDHYYGIIYTLPYIFIGAVIQEFINKNKKVGFIVTAAFLVILVPPAIKNSPIKYPPNRQLERSEVVSQRIIDEAKGEPFNIAVIAERNYEGAYQYYLERVNADFVIIDAQNTDDTITKQLFVICELPRKKCDPTHNDKAEVANFGWSVIDETWEIFGTTLFKLVHSQK